MHNDGAVVLAPSDKLYLILLPLNRYCYVFFLLNLGWNFFDFTVNDLEETF